MEVGSGVTRFSPGQRVVTPHHVACGTCRQCRSGAATGCSTFRQEQLEPGGFSEYVLVRQPAVSLAARHLPDELSSEAAVFLEPSACVLRGVDRSAIESIARAGLEVSAVVLGGGSMGLLHLLVLRCLLPTATIVVSEPLEERRRVALDLGATAAIPPADLATTVTERTDEGADAVFDTAGDPTLLEPSLSLLRHGGTLVLFSHFRHGPVGAVHEALFHHERRIVGTYSGALEEQQRIFRLLVSGALRPQSLVTHSLPLSQFHRAVELATTRAALKILMVPG